jgi:CNT family concentrative nucleoside transporter
MQFLIGLAGIAVILGIAVLLSSDRKAIRLRTVGTAFALQAGIAVLVLYTPWGQEGIQQMAHGVDNLLGYARQGTNFLFGDLNNAQCLLSVADPGQSITVPTGAVLAQPTLNCAKPFHAFALGALPVIIFFAALVSILYHLGIMQRIVRWVGGAIGWVTGIGRVEALGSAANIFVGQSESPLVVRPYLAALTPPQLFCLMTVGMAGVAGTILAAYAGLLGERYLPSLLAAAFMSAPGGILMAKIIMPDTIKPKEPEQLELPAARISGEGPAALLPEGNPGHHDTVDIAETFEEGERPANIIMAAAQGAQTGVKLAVAVGAMVLAFVALVALANGILSGIGSWFGAENLTFESILGTVFRPIMYLIGIPWEEAAPAGGLFGTKVVANEFVAFLSLGDPQSAAAVLSERSRAIVTFALCGFANFSSIAIQLAVTGNLAPNQRPTIARLGIRALIAGSLANLMSAALAGLLLP